jgi:hypothetical protein
MKLLRSKRIGMGVIEIIIGVAVIILIGGGIWYALNGSKKNEPTPAPTTVEVKKEAKLIWQQTPDGWQASETPPDCPAQPMLKTPTNLSKVTSILYPGQRRGGNYKSHGGFRLDGTSNSLVVVTAPTDGYVVRGAQYIEQGEVQYMFDIMNNCGVMYRLDHLNNLSVKLKDVAKTWPPAQVDSSQTQPVTATVYIEAGETLATSVGFVKSKNTFFDFGVYDFRSQNEISKSATYQAAHNQFKETDWHAVCWFNWMPEADEKIIRALPSGDPASGKTSDYCR